MCCRKKHLSLDTLVPLLVNLFCKIWNNTTTNSVRFENKQKMINTSRPLFVLCTTEKARRLCEGHETRQSGTGARGTELPILPMRAKGMTIVVSDCIKLYRLFVEQKWDGTCGVQSHHSKSIYSVFKVSNIFFFILCN